MKFIYCLSPEDLHFKLNNMNPLCFVLCNVLVFRFLHTISGTIFICMLCLLDFATPSLCYAGLLAGLFICYWVSSQLSCLVNNLALVLVGSCP